MAALRGLRVIDLTSGVAGSAATMLLSDHGADVIKIERADGDPIRSYPGSVVWNRGKRSVVLDLNLEADRTSFRRLVATADVLIEGFTPGRMAIWGLDFDALHAEFPSLIYCSLTGYGRDNAASQRPGYDLLVQARSGVQYEQPGWRDGPIFLYSPLPSYTACFLTLNGVLSALHARELTGRGQWVETSLRQGVLGITTQLWQDIEHGEGLWGIPMNPQMGVFECSDGLWIHSMHNSGGRGKDKSAVWRILDIEPQELITDPEVMMANEVKIREAVRKIPRQRLLDEFRANDLAVGAVCEAHEALVDEQVLNNGMVVDVIDPVVGPTKQMGISFRLHGAPPAQVQGPQPAIGQHTVEVLGGLATDERMAAVARPQVRAMKHPLDGIKVLDIGNFLAGPFGPMLLGDLGATVYKLESPDGDQMRHVHKPFNGCQRGKLDIVADLKSPEGREIAHRLIREVDVVHHNMRPGVAERLGVDYATAKRLNPKIIYCHTTMWGVDGPRRDWPGFDQLGQSTSGLEYELGGEGNPPVWYRFGMCDQVCAFQSAVGVLMALYWRDRTGEGQFVDTSIINGGIFLNSDMWIGENGHHVRPQLDATQTGISPLYRLYQTADGWLALACMRPDHWVSLCNTVPAVGVADADIGAVLAAELAQYSSVDAFALLDQAGVPVEISDPAAATSWFTDPDFVRNGLVVEYQHLEYGRMRQFGHLVHFSETPGRIETAPPVLGEHSVQVLESLGYDRAEIDDLRARGVTAWP